MKLLKFEAPWCTACKGMTEVFKSMGSKLTIPVEVINIDETPAMPAQYKVRGIPTLILVDDDGNELKRSTRVMSERDIELFVSQ